MSARTKLNIAVLNGALLISSVIGAASGSWAAFCVSLVILAASGCYAGDIRLTRTHGTRTRGEPR